jgi:hypothetical protein
MDKPPTESVEQLRNAIQGNWRRIRRITARTRQLLENAIPRAENDHSEPDGRIGKKPR